MGPFGRRVKPGRVTIMTVQSNIENKDVIVRSVEDRDMGAVTSIYAHHVLHGKASFEEIAPAEEDMVKRKKTLCEGGYPYLVAERQGRIIGYTYAGPYRARPAYRNSVENSVYVSPDCAGGGVGAALLTALIAACTDTGYRQMIAIIGDSANEASIRLHARCGFRHVGTIENVGFKHGVWLDSVIMQRALGDGAETRPDAVR